MERREENRAWGWWVEHGNREYFWDRDGVCGTRSHPNGAPLIQSFETKAENLGLYFQSKGKILPVEKGHSEFHVSWYQGQVQRARPQEGKGNPGSQEVTEMEQREQALDRVKKSQKRNWQYPNVGVEWQAVSVHEPPLPPHKFLAQGGGHHVELWHLSSRECQVGIDFTVGEAWHTGEHLEKSYQAAPMQRGPISGSGGHGATDTWPPQSCQEGREP